MTAWRRDAIDINVGVASSIGICSTLPRGARGEDYLARREAETSPDDALRDARCKIYWHAM